MTDEDKDTLCLILRERLAIGIMHCKKLMLRSDYDLEKAVEIYHKDIDKGFDGRFIYFERKGVNL